MDWFKKLKNKSDQSKRFLSFSTALVITLVFSVPWFFYKYVDEKIPEEQKTTPVNDVSATVSRPLGKIIKETKDAIVSKFSDFFLGEDEYEKK